MTDGKPEPGIWYVADMHVRGSNGTYHDFRFAAVEGSPPYPASAIRYFRIVEENPTFLAGYTAILSATLQNEFLGVEPKWTKGTGSQPDPFVVTELSCGVLKVRT